MACLSLNVLAETNSQKLRDLNQEISKLDKSIESDEKKQIELELMMRDIDMQINRTSQELQQINNQIIKSQKALLVLNEQQTQAFDDLHAQRDHLEKQIQQAYINGQTPTLKMLLSQDDAKAFSRLMVYYQYIHKAHKESIASLNTQLEAIQAREHLIEEALLQQKDLQQKHLGEYQALRDEQAKRENVLAALNKSITEKGNRVTKLREDAQGLNKIIERLAKQTEKAAQLTGLDKNLRWPTDGTLRYTFNTPRQDGAVRWQGIFIASEEGKPIKAVRGGKVIFADWLKGYGLLVIVDHGNSYMSLYAYNESLYKKEGDLVLADETIASVGKSGGMSEPGLYFEIRHAGNPIDPLAWLKQQS